MKEFGIFLIAVGVLGLLAAMNMDTTVYTPSQSTGFGTEFYTYVPPQEVENLGLMDRRRNWLTLSGLAVVSGVLLFGFGVLSEQGQARTPGNATRPRTDKTLGPVTVFTTLDTNSETPEAEGDDLDKVLNGERLPPKFDERGNPLQQPEQGSLFTEFLKSE